MHRYRSMAKQSTCLGHDFTANHHSWREKEHLVLSICGLITFELIQSLHGTSSEGQQLIRARKCRAKSPHIFYSPCPLATMYCSGAVNSQENWSRADYTFQINYRCCCSTLGVGEFGDIIVMTCCEDDTRLCHSLLADGSLTS